MPTQSEIITQLSAMAEPEYAAFASRLIPGCPPMLGVRLPALRRYAAKLARDPAGPQAVVAQLGPEVFETRMLRGMVIGCAKLPSGERWRMLEDFLPLADNWSLCDSTAAGCRFMAKAPGFWLPRLQELARRDQEFPARFGLVCLLDHFTGTPEGRRLTPAPPPPAPAFTPGWGPPGL